MEKISLTNRPKAKTPQMQFTITFLNNLKKREIKNAIKVIDESDSHIKRIKILFKNKLILSIVFGIYTHGFTENKLEIAVIDKGGEFKPEYLEGNEVLGYLNREEVEKYIEKIGKINIKKEDGKINYNRFENLEKE